MLDDFSKTVNGVIRDHEEDVKAIRENIVKLDERIVRLEEFRKETETKFEINKQDHAGFHREIIHNEENIKLINKEIATLNDNLSYTKKLSTYVKDL